MMNDEYSISSIQQILMLTATTNGIRISVISTYMPEYSAASRHNYVFAYQITIENDSPHTVKLLRRHWYIHDADGSVREVQGEGVIGLQPVLEPGWKHEYTSGCNFNTTIGKMRGTYLMERLYDGKTFEVTIPEFVMVVPYRLN